MAIVPLCKVTFYGAAAQKASVLHALQEMGCMHLVDLSGEEPQGPPASALAVETHEALKFLQACPMRQGAATDEGRFRLQEVVQEALAIERRQKELAQDKDELLAAIEALRPWGDFRLPRDGEFGGLRLWFYMIPHYRMEVLDDYPAVWQVVARDQRFAYVVVLSREEPEGLPVPPLPLAPRSLSELRQHRADVDMELDALHWRRVALTRWIESIERSIALADDEAARHQAARMSVDDPHVMALQGWVPERDRDRMRAFAAAHTLALVIESPGADDSPPTLLQNPPLTAGGEDAVIFYITPAYHAWDPSSMVFVFFSVFFAMIVADAGYALLLGVGLLLLWRRLGYSSRGVRMRRLAAAIVIASVAYGVLVGIYFGLPARPGTLLGHLRLIDPADTRLMIGLAISLGVLHLVLANLAVAWRRRRSLRMLASLGWAAVFLGGFAVGLGQTEVEPSGALVRFGSWALASGIAAVFLFSSDRPLATLQWRPHVGRVFDGLLALTQITRAFGDVLSYLRLFALGLASTQLAATFNELSYEASAFAGVGALLAVLVAVFGHGLNLTLAVMGGVIHGLRLNCIEFFGWGLTEEGYPYRPFSKKAA